MWRIPKAHYRSHWGTVQQPKPQQIKTFLLDRLSQGPGSHCPVAGGRGRPLWGKLILHCPHIILHLNFSAEFQDPHFLLRLDLPRGPPPWNAFRQTWSPSPLDPCFSKWVPPSTSIGVKPKCVVSVQVPGPPHPLGHDDRKSGLSVNATGRCAGHRRLSTAALELLT